MNDRRLFWIERIYTKYSSNLVTDIFLSIIISCLIPFVFFLPFLIQRPYVWGNYNNRMTLGITSATIWLALSPYFIKLYVKGTYDFFLNLEKTIKNKLLLNDIKHNFECNFAKGRKFTILLIIWTVGLESAILLDPQYLEKFGFKGYQDPYFYIFCLCISYFTYLSAIGFSGIINTIIIINSSVKKKIISIDFFHTDGHGGISFIIRYIFMVGKLFTTGILFIPILLDYIIFTEYYSIKLILYITIFIFSFSIFLLFFYPTKKIYDYANCYKNKYLKKITYKYQKNIDISLSHSNKGHFQKEIKVMNLYNYIQMVKSTTVFNIDFEQSVQMGVTVIIPLLSMFINYKDIIDLLNTIWSL